MATFSNDTKFDSTFQKALLPLINNRNCNEFTVAVGYVGESILRKMESKLLEIANRGKCRVIIGLLFHEGCYQSKKDYLEELDGKLRDKNASSGIFVTRFQYHGKVYKVVNDQVSRVFVGSSNFSTPSWTTRKEFNIDVTQSQAKSKSLAFVDYILSHKDTVPLTAVPIKLKKRGSNKVNIRKELQNNIVNRAIYNALPAPVGQFDHLLRVDANLASGLNLYFDRGRRIDGSDKFEPRPWFEIELASQATEIGNQYYPKSVLIGKKPSSTARTGDFTAFIKDGQKIYKFDMKVGGSGGKNIYSAKSSGGRKVLGQYIKGKLHNAGLLKEGDLITSETLIGYGRDTITFKKIDDSKYIIDFSVPDEIEDIDGE